MFRVRVVAPFLFLAAGCSSTTPRMPPATASQAIGPCEKLSIIQDGKDVADADGVFRLARRPFTVRYRGAEHPGLAVSPTTELIDALHRRARRELWGSAGDFIALSPNDLPLTKEFEIFVDDKSRSEFAEVLVQPAQSSPGVHASCSRPGSTASTVWASE
ncbi:hypothetical protein OV203_05000 [Nannocystis sp. ILAH1]|uniref:hypothetical protein n=1 Tax=Nannocystis sp. ILAH1 TaxID=2996789 RepID=UPI00226DF192|nr:hypothetical protein [Nannocystis sp. ILAH1]MCY0986463.1 hypothetical protein [Nannocystis sp. ILAH1]